MVAWPLERKKVAYWNFRIGVKAFVEKVSWILCFLRPVSLGLLTFEKRGKNVYDMDMGNMPFSCLLLLFTTFIDALSNFGAKTVK